MNTEAKLRRILVPLDGTKHSETILPWLEQLALVHGAQLELLRVVDPMNFARDAPAGNQREQVDQAKKYLRDLQSDLSGVSVATVCGLGPVAQVIRDRALKEHCDLIAFAPRGHGGLKRWLFGSVAETVVRDAPCPVLLVRGDARAHFHHVLMPLAQDDDVQSLYHSLAGYLTPTTRLSLLHCCGGQPVHGDLRSCVSRLVQERPNTLFVPSESHAPSGILDWARSSDCDLIAMSTHGLGGLHHLFKGSVMEQVGRHAPCPVLVLPRSERERRRSTSLSAAAGETLSEQAEHSRPPETKK